MLQKFYRGFPETLPTTGADQLVAMMVLLLPEVRRPGITGKPWVPVVDFLGTRRAFWVPGASVGRSTRSSPAQENFRPDEATAVTNPVGEGRESREASSGPDPVASKSDFPGRESP